MTTMKTYLTSYKKELEAYMTSCLKEFITDQAQGIDLEVAELCGVLRDACFGGKCIRGGLAKLGYEIAAGEKSDERILPISAALEILQAAVLAHDDIIDRSPTRRGKDSVWQKIAREKDDFHYGLSQAVCLGDMGIFLANRLITDSNYPAERRLSALSILNLTGLNTIGGEMLDVATAASKDYSEEDRILRISRFKTAWYTIVGPLQIGATLGGASLELLRRIQDFGMALGIAFQLKDDVLGILGSEEETGKSNTSDIAEGKVTLLIHYALKNMNSQQKELLFSSYGNPQAGEKERSAVIEVFSSTGAFEEIKKQALNYLEQAKRLVPSIAASPEYAALLLDLSDMMFDRKK